MKRKIRNITGVLMIVIAIIYEIYLSLQYWYLNETALFFKTFWQQIILLLVIAIGYVFIEI